MGAEAGRCEGVRAEAGGCEGWGLRLVGVRG